METYYEETLSDEDSVHLLVCIDPAGSPGPVEERTEPVGLVAMTDHDTERGTAELAYWLDPDAGVKGTPLRRRAGWSSMASTSGRSESGRRKSWAGTTAPSRWSIGGSPEVGLAVGVLSRRRVARPAMVRPAPNGARVVAYQTRVQDRVDDVSEDERDEPQRGGDAAEPSVFGSEDFGYRSRQCQQQDVVDDGDTDDGQEDVNRQRREVDELIDCVGAGELGGPLTTTL